MRRAQSGAQGSAERRMSGARPGTRDCGSPEWGSLGRGDALEVVRHILEGLLHGGTVRGEVLVNRMDTATPSQKAHSGRGDRQLAHTSGGGRSWWARGVGRGHS